MGNLIHYDARPDLEAVQMNNGHTSVVISVLAIAASRLAKTDHEKEFAVWLAEHDQGVLGTGVVGFDIDEIPWSVEHFAEDKAFLLGVIEAAIARTGWEVLDYAPREDWVVASLREFRVLVDAFSADHIVADESHAWPYGRPTRFALCDEHRVYLHVEGCVVCNDR